MYCIQSSAPEILILWKPSVRIVLLTEGLQLCCELFKGTLGSQQFAFLVTCSSAVLSQNSTMTQTPLSRVNIVQFIY